MRRTQCSTAGPSNECEHPEGELPASAGKGVPSSISMTDAALLGVLQTHCFVKCPISSKHNLQIQGTLVVWFCSALNMELDLLAISWTSPETL